MGQLSWKDKEEFREGISAYSFPTQSLDLGTQLLELLHAGSYNLLDWKQSCIRLIEQDLCSRHFMYHSTAFKGKNCAVFTLIVLAHRKDT